MAEAGLCCCPQALPLFSGLGNPGQSSQAERDFQPEGLRKVWALE